MRLSLITLLLLIASCAPKPDPVLLSYQAESQASSAKQAQDEAEMSRRQITRTVSPNLQKQATAYLRQRLLDGDSAKYRFDYTTSIGNSTGVCGVVNAKNQFGAFTGFSRFYVEFRDGVPTSADTIPLTMLPTRMLAVCGSP